MDQTSKKLQKNIDCKKVWIRIMIARNPGHPKSRYFWTGLIFPIGSRNYTEEYNYVPQSLVGLDLCRRRVDNCFCLTISGELPLNMIDLAINIIAGWFNYFWWIASKYDWPRNEYHCLLFATISGELPLKYLPSKFYRYEMSNCLFEAAYERILTDCNCTPSFHQVCIYLKNTVRILIPDHLVTSD